MKLSPQVLTILKNIINVAPKLSPILGSSILVIDGISK